MSKQHSTTDAPFTARDGALRMRLLLSWKERLALQPRQDTAALRVADREIAALRDQVRASIEQAAEALRAALAAHTPDGGQVERLRNQIGQFNVLLKASASSELGGFADLPLDQYPVELGLNRKSAKFNLDSDDRITLVAAPVIMLAVCLGLAWYYLWRADVNFTLDRPDSGHLVVNFQNDSSFTTWFYGPWPDSSAELSSPSFGITLFCRAEGSEDFQDCTNLREVWAYQGQPIPPRKPIQVETGVVVAVVLDLHELEKAYGSSIEEVRLQCGAARRRTQFEFTESGPPE